MSRFGLAALLFAATGCSLLTKLDGLAGDGGDAQAPVDAATEQPVCGVVGNACCAPNTCSGGATCTQNTCTCPSTTTTCGATCSDLQSDPKNCGACGHSCVGGACQAGACKPTVLVTGQLNVRAIAITPTKLLWARSNGSVVSGGVFSADLDGQNVAPLYDAKQTTCGALTATATDAYFYCTPNLLHCSLPACSDATVLATATGVSDLALDAQNARLYFTVRTPYNAQTGGYVGSIPIAGGAIVRVVPNDQPNPTNLRIGGGTVYWLNGGTYSNDTPQNNGGLRKAPLGVNPSETVVVTDIAGSDYAGLWLDGSTLYYGAGSAREIHSTSIVGGSASKFAVSTTNPSAVVADSTFVYWTSLLLNGGLTRCEKTCVNPTPLAGGGDALSLAQDAVSLYWGNGAGEIRRLAK